MKLLIAIVQDTDATRLRSELTRNGFKSTKLASTGGFLREGNTTFLIGVEDHQMPRVEELIRATCQQRVKSLPSGTLLEVAESLYTDPIEVTVGGAVVFVVPLDDMIRI